MIKVAGKPEFITKSKEEWKKKLQPGDIFITTHGKPEDFADRVFQAFSRRLQGEISHAGMYVGDGKVVEMSGKMHHRNIDGQVAGRDAWIVRPKVPKKDRLEAVSKIVEIAKSHGRKADYASVPFLLKVIAEDVTKGRTFSDAGDKEIEKQRFICSNLVTHAYKDKLDFVPDKGRGYVIPRDFLRSDKVERVARLLNPKRRDADQREPLGDGSDKVAYIGQCGPSGSEESWLQQFQGTPLHSAAVALEEQQLALEEKDLERRQAQQAQRQAEEASWTERDALRVQRLRLQLELQKLRAAEEFAAMPLADKVSGLMSALKSVGRALDPAKKAVPKPRPSMISTTPESLARQRRWRELGDAAVATKGASFGRDVASNLAAFRQHALRMRKAPAASVDAMNKTLLHAKEAPLPTASFLRPAAAAAPTPAPAAAAVAKKARPTVAHSPVELGKHLAKTNPDAAVAAAKQGLPVTGNASVLDRLSSMSFDKLSRLRAQVR